MEELIGKIVGIMYSNRGTGYYILKVQPEKPASVVTVKGSFLGQPVAVGIKIHARGIWGDHPQYGREFRMTTCEVLPEKSRSGIITYLVNNVPSIGPVTAGKLYAVYGDDLITLLDTEPEKLADCDFLSQKQIESIIDEWRVASEQRTAAIFLSNLGLTASQIRSVYTRFGIESVRLVKENPYWLYECPGVGFQTSDNVARQLGVGRDDQRRVNAMILYIIHELSSSEGHMYVSADQIREYVQRLFKKIGLDPFSHGEYLSDISFYTALDQLKEDDDIVVDNSRIYSIQNWQYESESAKYLVDLLANGPKDLGDLSGFLDKYEKRRNITLSEHQRQALMLLEHSKVCVISGYPGTGKTTLISAFVDLFEENHLHYVLLSPTGIASKRLSQVTGKPASTIHRALGYKRDGGWEFHSSNKFHVDAVIVDETSMVDGATFYHLISALPSTTILICVGDSAQLPSVGAGYVLNNLMRCDDVPHVSLTRIYRQTDRSDIITVAHQILAGDAIDTDFRKDSQFVFFRFPQPQVADEICALTERMMTRDALFQVIAPKYDGELGVNNLNKKLREILNPMYIAGNAYKIKHGVCDLYEGDRIMVVKNDYDRMIFNGDVGKVQRISAKDDVVEVKIFEWFNHESTVPEYIDKTFTFKIEECRSMLNVAYACTAHKCVSPDTLVETPEGLIRISDIPSDGSIATPSGGAEYHSKVNNPSSRMLRITTSDGYVLETTPDHGMDTWDSKYGYIRRPASELVEGNLLALRLGVQWGEQSNRFLPAPISGHYNEVQYPVPTELDVHMAEFLGIMVADGTVFDGGFRMITSSNDVIIRFDELCKLLFKCHPKHIDHNGTAGIEVHSTFLSRWLLDIGGIGPENKSVPLSVLRSSLTVQAAFLRGLFEDGTVNMNPDLGTVDHIELLTCYESLYKDVKVMLLRFGIISGYGERRQTLSDGCVKTYRIIYIYGRNVGRFADVIGFITDEKQLRAKSLYGNECHYQVPILKAEALSIRDINGGPKFFTFADKNVLTRGYMSRHQLESLLSRIQIENNESRALRERIKFHHSVISRIEIFDGPSMCVEVPDGHRFIQNGFCGWNCQGREFDYILMPMTMQYGMMLYRNLIYTAITRAKKKVFLFGDPNAFLYAAANERDNVRNSDLGKQISEFVLESLRAPETLVEALQAVGAGS